MEATMNSIAPRLSAEGDAMLSKLRQQTLSNLRENIKLKDKVFSMQSAARKRREQERRELLRGLGVNLQRIDEADQRDDEELKEFLEELRPELLAARPDDSATARARERELWVRQMGQPVPPASADLLTGLRSGAEPDFTTLVARDIKNISRDSGWGCGIRENPAYPDTTAYWWHVYTPEQTRTYTFYINAPYSGFYVIRADDSWYNCKHAKTYGFYELDVYQFGWRGADRRAVVDRWGTNINKTGRLEGSITWSFSQALEAGAPVTVQVKVVLDVFAKGSGSYAELNFADGASNYVDQPSVFIY